MQAKNIFDSYKGKVYSNSKKTYKLELIEKIGSYQTESGSEEMTTRIATLSRKNEQLIILDKYEYQFIIFDLNTFTNNTKPLKIIRKAKGKGPNEMIFPIDIIYDDFRDRLYIADLNNFRIYIYDNEYNEIKRIKLDFRPYRMFLSENFLYLNHYDSPTEYCIERIDLNSSEQIEGLFKPSGKGDFLEEEARNKFFIANSNEEENKFFIGRNHPNFTIYEVNSGKIQKAFCNPLLNKKKLPKPEYFIFENDKKVKGIYSFSNWEYSHSQKLLFTLTTLGWYELVEKKGLDRYICIFDEAGNTLCEHKILPYGGEENNIIFDEKNSVIYYATYGNIWKFKMIEISEP